MSGRLAFDRAVSWLPDPAPASLQQALGEVAPELAGRPVLCRERAMSGDPRFFKHSALVDGRVLVKFAWSEGPARGIVREALVLAALADSGLGLQVPEVVFASSQPALLGTRWVDGQPIAPWDVDAADSDWRGQLVGDLGGFLARLHAPEPLRAVQKLQIPLPAPEPQATTHELRMRFLPLIAAPQRSLVADWCDWTDSVLAAPPETEVLMHGDLHGFNVAWDANSRALRLVADWDAAGLGDCAYDFRYLPGLAATPEFFVEVCTAYERAGGRPIDRRRVMAWHIRSALGDALWRTEAGICLPGGGTASSWAADVHARVTDLQIC